MAFGKVFSSLFTGSMYGRANEQLVFIYMLSNCSAEGVFDGTPESIAGPTGLSVEAVRAALCELGNPDPRSRSTEQEGRRITLLSEHRDWGWHIVNYAYYRNLRDAEVRRAQVREAVRRHRETKSGVISVSKVSHGKPKQKQKQKQKESKSIGHRDAVDRAFESFWTKYPRKVAKAAARLVFASTVGGFYAKAEANPDEVVPQVTQFELALDAAIKSWEYTEPRFIPHARTWLNQRRWED